jgi:hypothetical protein
MASRTDVSGKTDPRRLRELMDRLVVMAEAHDVPSVVVGLAGQDGDPLIPEFMDYVESALRMEDAIFRMTRERSVLFLADVDAERAEGIVSRLVESFAERFPAAKSPAVELGFCEITPTGRPPALRDALLQVFPSRD